MPIDFYAFIDRPCIFQKIQHTKHRNYSVQYIEYTSKIAAHPMSARYTLQHRRCALLAQMPPELLGPYKVSEGVSLLYHLGLL